MNVLVIAKDFGGNVPMVTTWAWTWGSSGPIRLDVRAALKQAIHIVAPDYDGYDTGIEWNTLHGLTWVWKGAYPGKIGVDVGGPRQGAWAGLTPPAKLLWSTTEGR